MAKRVHHVEDRVHVREPLRPRRQQRDRIEHAAEVDQRRQHEGREPGDLVEVLRKDGVEEAAEREDHGGQQHGTHDEERVRDRHVREEERDAGDHHADEQSAHHAARDVAEHDQPVGQRRDQQLLDVLAELRAEEARDDVAVGVADDGHHDEAGGDVLHVVEAVHLPDALADEAAEDQEVERRGDGRRHQRLAPDAHDAAELAPHDGLEADAPDAREGFFLHLSATPPTARPGARRGA